jgi:hypothetical protein
MAGAVLLGRENGAGSAFIGAAGEGGERARGGEGIRAGARVQPGQAGARRQALGTSARCRAPAGILCCVVSGGRAGCGVREGGVAMVVVVSGLSSEQSWRMQT